MNKRHARILDALRAVNPAGQALRAPDRRPLTFAALGAQIAATAGSLAALGIGRGNSVGIVLPNGPEMASAFLAVSASAVAAPLNPAYKEDEFDFYLSDLEARLLIVLSGDDTPARAVAARRGIPVAELTVPEGAAAGEFALSVSSRHLAPVAAAAFNEPDDAALVLHTSGTTSRPKIVPLTARNIAASAQNIADTLALSPADRCLNIMPLFHIHGLIGALSSSLVAGASVVATPGFNALRFFGWLRDEKPTWYSAVPTMHQAILGRATRAAEIIAEAPLRFIRSSSASLPPPVLRELEEVFGCPVIESYGMTEAAHQMTSNRLPPGKREPGSVGAAAGPEVAIMAADGKLLAKGETGEIVIRGANVTRGYLNNDKANAEAFTNGWFRTGDQGVMDADGYVTINGRLKEIINRGGEKIAPREVDDVLLEHPAVAQALTFAVPHDKLGEDVAAVVVLREGASANATEIRDHCALALAAFKVPREILFMDELPKGATGKLQRIGLAARLGLGAR